MMIPPRVRSRPWSPTWELDFDGAESGNNVAVEDHFTHVAVFVRSSSAVHEMVRNSPKINRTTANN